MAKNNMSFKQELLARLFYENVAQVAEDFLPNQPVTARQLRGILLDMLGYKQLPTGARVDKETEIKGAFGANIYEEYQDEWEADTNAIIAALETSTSESSTSAKIREAILSEDV